MRKAALLGAAVLMLAACTVSGDDSAAETGLETATTLATPTSETTPAGADSAPAIGAEVLFDGEACSYSGPSAVPDGTKVTFVFEATAKPDDIALVVGGVEPGTTWEQFTDWAATTAAGGPPPFAARGYRVIYGPGALEMTLIETDYMVACATSPSDTNENFAAGFIQVTGT